MRPPRIMLRNLVDLSLENAQDSLSSLLGMRVTALYACMTFAMLTITYGAGASLGVITPVLQVGYQARRDLAQILRLTRCIFCSSSCRFAVPVRLHDSCRAHHHIRRWRFPGRHHARPSGQQQGSLPEGTS